MVIEDFKDLLMEKFGFSSEEEIVGKIFPVLKPFKVSISENFFSIREKTLIQIVSVDILSDTFTVEIFNPQIDIGPFIVSIAKLISSISTKNVKVLDRDEEVVVFLKSVTLGRFVPVYLNLLKGSLKPNESNEKIKIIN